MKEKEKRKNIFIVQFAKRRKRKGIGYFNFYVLVYVYFDIFDLLCIFVQTGALNENHFTILA